MIRKSGYRSPELDPAHGNAMAKREALRAGPR